jgi:hypothetical protein
MMADTPFADAYPHLTRSFVRVLDMGGLVWEGGEVNTSLDEVLRTVDTALADILKEFGR